MRERNTIEWAAATANQARPKRDRLIFKERRKTLNFLTWTERTYWMMRIWSMQAAKAAKNPNSLPGRAKVTMEP